MRRAHWRRQHYGRGRSLSYRVWVAPILVNAGRFVDVGPRVYRIPAPTPGAPETVSPLA